MMPITRTLNRTMYQVRNTGPTVNVRRFALPGETHLQPIFIQVANQVINFRPHEMRLPNKAWKVYI